MGLDGQMRARPTWRSSAGTAESTAGLGELPPAPLLLGSRPRSWGTALGDVLFRCTASSPSIPRSQHRREQIFPEGSQVQPVRRARPAPGISEPEQGLLEAQVLPSVLRGDLLLHAAVSTACWAQDCFSPPAPSRFDRDSNTETGVPFLPSDETFLSL